MCENRKSIKTSRYSWIFIFMLLLSLKIPNAYCSENLELLTLIKVKPEYRLVAHAGGGIGGFSYTNSKEALTLNYRMGQRIFELDLLLLSGKIICAHDLGHLQKITGIKGNPTNMSIRDLKKAKIYDNFTVMELKDVFEFLENHKDAFLITDSKSPSEALLHIDFDEYNEKFWKLFVEEASHTSKSILKRVIPQLYYPRMYEIIEYIHKFDVYILTLYKNKLTNEDIIKFVKAHPKVKIIPMHHTRIKDKEFIYKLHSLNRLVAVHTVNDLDRAKFVLSEGADLIYTDFIVSLNLPLISQQFIMER